MRGSTFGLASWLSAFVLGASFDYYLRRPASGHGLRRPTARSGEAFDAVHPLTAPIHSP
ncbi:MAG: hypothetical protein LC802_22280 [Acidobacteria bacterium]|nr:hypothetical protein [Acidobacteriota bacterium]